MVVSTVLFIFAVQRYDEVSKYPKKISLFQRKKTYLCIRNSDSNHSFIFNMKRSIIFLASMLLLAGQATAGGKRTPAFPGAEGFGKYATGGRAIDDRGANVYYVTRLDDCKDSELVEGTLRWALRTGDDTPRTILFKVGGTIYLQSTLSMAHPNVSILGQSAPGGGICIAGYTMKICKPNVIIRYIRFRAGDLPNKSMTSLDVENTRNVILDHCSMTWSMEENLTLYDTDSTTVQWCIIAEGLYRSKNAKGARCYATQWGGEHGTMHHCLISNVNNRTPRFNGMRKTSKHRGDHDQFVDNEFINNVIFNWGKPNSIYGGECYKDCNDGNSYNRVYMINNYFRPGPNTQAHVTDQRYFAWATSTKGRGLGQWLLKGNIFELSSYYAPKTAVWSDEILKKVNKDNLYGFAENSVERCFDTEDGASETIYNNHVIRKQKVKSDVKTYDAREAYRQVYQEAGASLPRYDEVDLRLLDEAAGIIAPQFYGKKEDGSMERALGIINSQNDVILRKEDPNMKGWPDLNGISTFVDSDSDGLPDDYEINNGLNPKDKNDGWQITKSGFSNLEIYLNAIH